MICHSKDFNHKEIAFENIKPQMIFLGFFRWESDLKARKVFYICFQVKTVLFLLINLILSSDSFPQYFAVSKVQKW